MGRIWHASAILLAITTAFLFPPASPLDSSSVLYGPTPCRAKAGRGYIISFARMAAVDDKPFIAFRSWFDDDRFGNGELVIAYPTAALPAGPDDWVLLGAGEENEVAWNDEGWIGWIDLAEIDGNIGCAFDCGMGSGGLGFCQSASADPGSQDELVSSLINAEDHVLGGACAISSYRGLPIVATCADRHSTLRVGWAKSRYPICQNDWVVQSVYSCPEDNKAIWDTSLTFASINDIPAVFFQVGTAYKGTMFMATPAVAGPQNPSWQITRLFPSMMIYQDKPAVHVANGIVTVLHTNKNKPSISQCPETFVAHASKWSSTPLLRHKDGRPEAYGFYHGKPLIAFCDFSREPVGLTLLLADSSVPRSANDWREFKLDTGSYAEVSLAEVDGKPTVAYFAYDPDRICYAYATTLNRTVEQDWQVCTVVEHNLLSWREQYNLSHPNQAEVPDQAEEAPVDQQTSDQPTSLGFIIGLVVLAIFGIALVLAIVRAGDTEPSE